MDFKHDLLEHIVERALHELPDAITARPNHHGSTHGGMLCEFRSRNHVVVPRAEILGASVLAIDGVMETDGDVHHLIADRIHDFSHLAGGLASKSRDFC